MQNFHKEPEGSSFSSKVMVSSIPSKLSDYIPKNAVHKKLLWSFLKIEIWWWHLYFRNGEEVFSYKYI